MKFNFLPNILFLSVLFLTSCLRPENPHQPIWQPGQCVWDERHGQILHITGFEPSEHYRFEDPNNPENYKVYPYSLSHKIFKLTDCPK